MGGLTDFADTAALIAQLDLLVGGIVPPEAGNGGIAGAGGGGRGGALDHGGERQGDGVDLIGQIVVIRLVVGRFGIQCRPLREQRRV